jgi:hypothetical protein
MAKSSVHCGRLLLYGTVLAAVVSCQAGSEPTAPNSRPPRDLAPGEYESPFRLDGRGIAPAGHLGPSKLEIVPINIQTGSDFVVPFGNNANFGFTGFVYRNVASFNLQAGDVIAFDLRGLARDATGTPRGDLRHSIYFATASANPQSCGQVVSAASGWTQVVTQNQLPQNPMGDTVTGNFELRFSAEAPFVFPGGGLLVGFETSPPAIAQCCTAAFPHTTCTDPDGRFHSRFFFLPNLTTGPLTGDGLGIGGIAILESGGAPPTCAEGVSLARSQIAQILPNRPFLRGILNFLLTRIEGGDPNAETNYGRLLDALAQLRLITTQEAADLKDLVALC